MYTKANMSIINQDCPYAMNQTCKVCGEPAAGFHFGAFTCEGCKSFFGRSYNNLASISDCKNNGECIINKKNRTACKACRLRKCILVGMSKSGSRYGRRSNWFKIHCLLQAQHQQQQQQHQQAQNAGAAHMVAAAAAAAAAAAVNANSNSSAAPGQKQSATCSSTTSLATSQVTPTTTTGSMNVGLVSPPTAAAAALGIFSHGSPYAGLYAPRTKEELMMLGLEVYKHAAPSPSVSSPDSHNSDNSGEGTARSNALLHMAGKHAEQAAASMSPQIRKELSPFLQLPFPNLATMPVMPPPSFLPPSHLLFPGYHSALYQHQHGALLRPMQPQQLRNKQQEQQTAAAVRHLISATASPNTQNQRFGAADLMALGSDHNRDNRDTAGSPLENSKDDTLNNNHLPNGSKMAEELTKCFYLDAMMKSQQQHGQHSSTIQSPPKLHARNDCRNNGSIDNDNEEEQHEENEDQETAHAVNEDSEDVKDTFKDNESRELIVSMTPPRSPTLKCNNNNNNDNNNKNNNDSRKVLEQQDNPIDLSIKMNSSAVSSVSSKCSRSSFVNDESDNEHEADMHQGKRERISSFSIIGKRKEAEDEVNKGLEQKATDEIEPPSKRIKFEESSSNQEETIDQEMENAQEREEQKEESVQNLLAEPPLDLTRKL